LLRCSVGDVLYLIQRSAIDRLTRGLQRFRLRQRLPLGPVCSTLTDLEDRSTFQFLMNGTISSRTQSGLTGLSMAHQEVHGSWHRYCSS
jgi:hypothetical protein